MRHSQDQRSPIQQTNLELGLAATLPPVEANRWLLTHDFSLIWWSQVLSQVADGVSRLALLWFVYSVTGSALKTSIVGLLQTLPPIVLGQVTFCFRLSPCFHCTFTTFPLCVHSFCIARSEASSLYSIPETMPTSKSPSNIQLRREPWAMPGA